MSREKIVDLSRTAEHGMVTCKGLPGPVIGDFLDRESSRGHYDEGKTFHIGRIKIAGDTGTYIDSPFHRYEIGRNACVSLRTRMPFGRRGQTPFGTAIKQGTN